MLIDCYLVVDGGETVGFADSVGDERGVVDAAWHVALVAGEQQYMREVEIAGFEHTHHLDALGGLSVEGDAGGLHELRHEALEGDDVDGERAVIHEVGDTVE